MAHRARMPGSVPGWASPSVPTERCERNPPCHKLPVADGMSGFGSRRFVRFLEVSKPGDRDATQGTDGKVYRMTGALSCGAIELRGDSGAAGVSERHFRRLRDRYEVEGAERLIDWRRGRASGRRAPV